jgi:hypothetical protein
MEDTCGRHRGGMLKRGMMFEGIDWSEDQATPPFEV